MAGSDLDQMKKDFSNLAPQEKEKTLVETQKKCSIITFYLKWAWQEGRNILVIVFTLGCSITVEEIIASQIQPFNISELCLSLGIS